MTTIPLRDIAFARSGDKGRGANIGVIAYTDAGYRFLVRELTTERVAKYLAPLGSLNTVRYELPNLMALNFVLPLVLGGGGSRSLRIDAQGKALGQALLQMPMEISDEELSQCLRHEQGVSHV